MEKLTNTPPLLSHIIFGCWPSRLGVLSLFVLTGMAVGEKLV